MGLSVAYSRPKAEPSAVPYTLRMSMAEGQIYTTICVMYRQGFHKELWNTCSNVLAGLGLNEAEARTVFRNADERAKRLLRV